MIVADYASVDEDARPNFAAFKSFGGGAAIVRAVYTYGSLVKVDPTPARDRDAAVKAGLVWGQYLILGWHADVEAQVAAMPDPLPGDMPPFLDIEFPGLKGRSDTGLTAEAALARCQLAYELLLKRFPVVGIYTSERVWREDLSSLASTLGRTAPLWLKTAYAYRVHNPPHLEARGQVGPLPRPWLVDGSPRAWIHQFQGDAIQVPGFSTTVDLSEFLTLTGVTDPRVPWVAEQLARHNTPIADGFGLTVQQFQSANGLDSDGMIGARTFAALTA